MAGALGPRWLRYGWKALGDSEPSSTKSGLFDGLFLEFLESYTKGGLPKDAAIDWTTEEHSRGA
jgi:hypothetical protein